LAVELTAADRRIKFAKARDPLFRLFKHWGWQSFGHKAGCAGLHCPAKSGS
jgi:hypothetical protein